MQLKEYNHFTVFATDAKRSESVLQGCVRHRHPFVPGTDVSNECHRSDGRIPDVHRRRGAGASGRTAASGQHQPCLSEHGQLPPDEVISTSESVGIKPREN